jgi:hypothetical protein
MPSSFNNACYALLALCLSGAGSSLASEIAIRLGPPAIGVGGTNPVSIPPSLLDAQFIYVTQRNLEFNVSVTGFYVGRREKINGGASVALGAGFVLDANGSGPGIYSAFTYDFWCGWVCASTEYLQGVGLTNSGVVSPYSWRLGVSRWF